MILIISFFMACCVLWANGKAVWASHPHFPRVRFWQNPIMKKTWKRNPHRYTVWTRSSVVFPLSRLNCQILLFQHHCLCVYTKHTPRRRRTAVGLAQAKLLKIYRTSTLLPVFLCIPLSFYWFCSSFPCKFIQFALNGRADFGLSWSKCAKTSFWCQKGVADVMRRAVIVKVGAGCQRQFDMRNNDRFTPDLISQCHRITQCVDNQ